MGLQPCPAPGIQVPGNETACNGLLYTLQYHGLHLVQIRLGCLSYPDLPL